MDGARRRATSTQRSPYDVRPRLLALCGGQDATSVQPSITYGVNYLRAWCERCGLQRGVDVIEAAAVDGLLAVYWGRARRKCGRPTIADRAVHFHVAPATFLTLKRVAEQAFRRRLREAVWERLAPTEWQTDCESKERPPAFADSARRAA